MREDSGYPHLDASTILLHPSCKPSQGGGWERHGHGSINPLLWIQNIPTHHVFYLPDKSSSQFLKLHDLSLGTWNPVAFIPAHVALSRWHGWRIKLLGCRICAMSSPRVPGEKMLPVTNSAQIKKEQLCTLYADLISLFTLRQCILEEWWTACSAATLPLPSSPPTPLFKPGQLCTEGTNNSSGTGRQQRHQKEVADGTRGLGECSWHRRSEARQLLGPTPAICWCTQRALQREEWNPW